MFMAFTPSSLDHFSTLRSFLGSGRACECSFPVFAASNPNSDWWSWVRRDSGKIWRRGILDRKSKSVRNTPEDRNRFVLPAPQEPLREWTVEEIGEEVVLESMELLSQAARSAPDFEMNRLQNKNPSRFTF